MFGILRYLLEFIKNNQTRFFCILYDFEDFLKCIFRPYQVA